jgi:hypothetical protein
MNCILPAGRRWLAANRRGSPQSQTNVRWGCDRCPSSKSYPHEFTRWFWTSGDSLPLWQARPAERFRSREPTCLWRIAIFKQINNSPHTGGRVPLARGCEADANRAALVRN